MRRFTPRGPPADGGYPLDSDLHQMSDDGGPVGPDPARWADPDWRDNLGEWDAFADEVRMGFPASSPLRDGKVTIRRPPVLDPLAVPTPSQVSRRVVDPGVSAGGDTRIPAWSSVRIEGDAAAVWTARQSYGGGPLDS